MPSAVKDVLVDVVEAARTQVPFARWLPRANMHVTLTFLGAVDESRLPEIAAVIGGSVSGLVDFPVALAGIGTFPDAAHARVIWVGLADPSRGMSTVASAVADALEPIGFPIDRRPFTPHITIARVREPARVEIGVEVPPVRFTVERVTLFESHLGRVPQYEPLATFPFRREAVRSDRASPPHLPGRDRGEPPS